jgi:hypothetical protein
MFSLRSNGYFLPVHHVRMDHYYSFARSVDHPRSDSVRLLLRDDMWQYLELWPCTTGPSEQRQPTKIFLKACETPKLYLSIWPAYEKDNTFISHHFRLLQSKKPRRVWRPFYIYIYTKWNHHSGMTISH